MNVRYFKHLVLVLGGVFCMINSSILRQIYNALIIAKQRCFSYLSWEIPASLLLFFGLLFYEKCQTERNAYIV